MKKTYTHSGQGWVRREAEKHTNPISIRKRIAQEQEHLRVLTGMSLSENVERALQAHAELIHVLSKRLHLHESAALRNIASHASTA